MYRVFEPRSLPLADCLSLPLQRKGWGSGVVFDDHMVSGMSSVGRLRSRNYEGAAARYDIETSGSGSMMTITTG
jgi:hypothetical protein